MQGLGKKNYTLAADAGGGEDAGDDKDAGAEEDFE